MRNALPAAALLLAACASTPQIEPTDGPRDHTIYLVSHGWHTGIVMRSAEIPAEVWPVAADFPDAVFLEVGWGDRHYYMTPGAGAGTASRAALFGGPGVLHIVALRETPRRAFPQSQVVALPVSRAGLKRLSTHIAASYERDAAGQPIALGAGLYGASRFYASLERFHLFNTCNVWTARSLRIAGLPIASALTADRIVENAREAAEQLTTPDASTRRNPARFLMESQSE